MLTPKRFLILTAGFVCLGLMHSSFALAAAKQPSLSDGQISEALMAIDHDEVSASKMVEKKTQNADVKNYAEAMIKDRTKNREQTKSLARKLSFDLKACEFSKKAESEEVAHSKELKQTDNIDKAYANMMVTIHQDTLTIMDRNFIPQAQNPMLREHLAKSRADVAAQLDQAKNLVTKLQ